MAQEVFSVKKHTKKVLYPQAKAEFLKYHPYLKPEEATHNIVLRHFMICYMDPEAKDRSRFLKNGGSHE